jgi:Peptidase A4 family
VRRSLTAAVFGLTALAFAVTLATAPAAFGDSRDSANWSGYAIHRPGVKFTTVSGSWTQPRATCTPGHRTYSAFWVGLGGYSLTSNSLEQIGTEVDCSVSGAVRSSAWYELVPAASRTIRLRVRPGDALRATVTVTGHQVYVVLDDLTSKRAFSKTLHANTVDVTSAEWIAEAPSECIGYDQCQTLPLADFGSASFNLAQARSTTGRVGSISDPAWRWTKLRLLPGGTRFVAAQGGGTSAGESTSSLLAANGTQFTVSYSQIAVPDTAFARARQASLSDGHLVH